jgi:hypothetical protein
MTGQPLCRPSLLEKKLRLGFVRSIFSAVIGSEVMRTPTASSMALAMAGGGHHPPERRHPLLPRQRRRALRRAVHRIGDQRTRAFQERGRRVGLFWTIEIPGDENQVNLGKGFASTPKPRILAALRPGTTGKADTHGYASQRCHAVLCV